MCPLTRCLLSLDCVDVRRPSSYPLTPALGAHVHRHMVATGPAPWDSKDTYSHSLSPLLVGPKQLVRRAWSILNCLQGRWLWTSTLTLDRG